MAIWQFNLDFYPIDGISNELGKVPNRLPIEFRIHQANYQEENPGSKFWVGYDRQMLTEIITSLSNQLPIIEWLKESKDVFGWGNEQTNDITLSFTDSNLVESFGCRIDMRTINEKFLELIIELCNSNQYLISDLKGNLRTPNRLELGKLMANSNPAKFVADSEKFIKDFIENDESQNDD